MLTFSNLAVYLVGGETSNEGNVYAYNPTQDIDGPVCDDYSWDENAVRLFLLCYDFFKLSTFRLYHLLLPVLNANCIHYQCQT